MEAHSKQKQKITMDIEEFLWENIKDLPKKDFTTVLDHLRGTKKEFRAYISIKRKKFH